MIDAKLTKQIMLEQMNKDIEKKRKTKEIMLEQMNRDISSRPISDNKNEQVHFAPVQAPSPANNLSVIPSVKAMTEINSDIEKRRRAAEQNTTDNKSAGQTMHSATAKDSTKSVDYSDSPFVRPDNSVLTPTEYKQKLGIKEGDYTPSIENYSKRDQAKSYTSKYNTYISDFSKNIDARTSDIATAADQAHAEILKAYNIASQKVTAANNAIVQFNSGKYTPGLSYAEERAQLYSNLKSAEDEKKKVEEQLSLAYNDKLYAEYMPYLEDPRLYEYTEKDFEEAYKGSKLPTDINDVFILDIESRNKLIGFDHNASTQEKQIYTYLYNHYGREKALKFMEDMSSLTDTRITKAFAEKAKEFFAQNNGTKLLGAGADVALGMVGAVTTPMETVKQGINLHTKGVPTNPYSLGFGVPVVQKGVHEGVTDGMNQFQKFAADAGISIVNNLTQVALFQGAAPLTMGATAMSQSMYDAIENGATPGEAFTRGILDGVAELAAEKISFGFLDKNTGKFFTDPTARNFVKSWLSQMGEEFAEESVTEVMSILNDAVVMKDRSQISQLYNSYLEAHPGEKSKAALDTAMKLLAQVGVSGVAGAFAGGIMSGGKMSVQAAPLVYNKAVEASTARPYKNNTEALERLANHIRNTNNASRSGMAAQSILNKIKAGEEPADSEINELVYAAINDRELVQRAIDHGMAQNNDSQAFAVASRLEKKLAKNRSVSAKEFKELILSEFSSVQNNSTDDVSFSVGKTTNNRPVAIIDKDILAGVPKYDWKETVKNQLKQVKSVGVGSSKININRTSRKEYLYSEYSNMLKSKEKSKYADKLRAAGNIEDVIYASTDYINEEPNHERKDNFESFARGSVLLQIGNNQYNADVVVGITYGGNAVLYDIVNIDNIAFDIEKASIPSATNNNGASQIEGDARNNSIHQNYTVVNSNSMQNSENDTKYTEEKRIKFESTARNVSSLKDGYGSYTKEQVRSFRRVADAFGIDVFVGNDNELGADGYYVRSHNGERAKIYLNAGGTNPLNAVIRHEVIHHIKATSIDAFNAFSNYVTERYIELYGEEAFEETLSEISETYRTKTGKELTRAESIDEFCADVGMDMFRSPSEAKRLAFADRNVLQRFLDAIREVLRKIEGVFANDWDYSFKRLSALESTTTAAEDGTVYHSHNTASESFMPLDVDSLKEAERVLAEVLKEHIENDEIVETSVRYSAPVENSSIKEQLFKSSNTLNKMEPVTRIEYYRTKNKKELKEKLLNEFKSFGYKIDRNGFGIIEIGEKEINTSLNYVNDESESAAFFAVPKVLKRGVIIDGHDNHKNRGFETVTFGAPVIINGKRGNIAVTVKRTKGNRYKTHRILMPDGSSFVYEESRGYPDKSLSNNDSESLSITSASKDIVYDNSTFVNTQNQETIPKSFTNKQQNDENDVLSDFQSLIPIEEFQRNEEYIPVTSKNRDIYRHNVNKMFRKAQSLFSVPYGEARKHIKPIIEELAAKLMNNNGHISDEDYFNLTVELIGRAQYIDREYYDMYKDLKNTLRNTRIFVPFSLQKNIPGWNNFRKSTMGVLTIANDGAPLDSVYAELSDNYPDFFPKDKHGEDQLYQLLDVAKNIKIVNKGYADYHGDNAEAMARSMMMEFKTFVNKEIVPELEAVKRVDSENATNEGYLLDEYADVTADNYDVEFAKNNLKQANELRKKISKIKSVTALTKRDEALIDQVVNGELLLSDLPQNCNRRAITEISNVEIERQALLAPVDAMNRSVRRARDAEAVEMVENLDLARDKKTPFQYMRETARRNLYDIFADKDKARVVYDSVFAPTSKNEAAKNRMINSFQKALAELNISQTATNGNNVSESFAIQYIGELRAAQRYLEEHPTEAKRNGLTRQGIADAFDTFIKENPELAEQMKSSDSKLNRAIKWFEQTYNSLFEMMNEVRIKNGYTYVDYRQGYFPHFSKTKGVEQGDNVINKLCASVGIDPNIEDIPTSIAGLTHSFKPGIKWMGNINRRMGNSTDYDALEGFERYVNVAAEVIYHTEDIARLRAFEEAIRTKYAPAAVQEKISTVKQDMKLSDEEKNSQIADLLSLAEVPKPREITQMSNFVVWLSDYTNIIAGKKSMLDRSVESVVGRKIYSAYSALNKRFAANMVGLNISSALTNFIPLCTASGQISYTSMLQAMHDTNKRLYSKPFPNIIYDDCFFEKSDYLVNRFTDKTFAKTKFDKVVNSLNMMEPIDRFVSETLVRGRYYDNVKKGMSEESALEEANIFAGNVQGDRSKGQLPTVFSSKVLGLLTQFQVEVNNDLSHIFKDIPSGNAKEIAKAFVHMFIANYLYNNIFEAMIGRRPALDPLGIVNKFAGNVWGFKLPSLSDTLINGKKFSFETEKKKLSESLSQASLDVLESLPFVGGIVGGGRLPISAALPDFETLVNATGNFVDAAEESLYAGATAETVDKMKKAAFTAGTQLAKPLAYLVPPAGGGQIKKTVEGVAAAVRKGVYGMDSKGRSVLKYPVDSDNTARDIANGVRMALFGKSSVPTARDWIEGGFKNLTADETDAYKQAIKLGASGDRSFLVISNMKMKETKNEKIAYLKEQNIPQNQKSLYYEKILASESELASAASIESKGSSKDDYYRYLLNTRHFESDYSDGEVVSGSLKRKKVRWLLNDKTIGAGDKSVIYGEVLASEKEREKADKLDSSGVTTEEYYKYIMNTSLIIQSDDESRNKQKLEYLTKSDLSMKKKAAIYREDIATDDRRKLMSQYNKVGITDSQIFSLVTNDYDIDKSYLDDVTFCKNADVDFYEYIKLRNEAKNVQSWKDKNGQTVPGSKRFQIEKLVSKMKLSPMQTMLVLRKLGYK